MSFKMDFEGGKDLEKALMDLKTATAKGVVRRAIKAALSPVADAMRTRTPRGKTGKLQESISVTGSVTQKPRSEDKGLARGSRAFVAVSAGPDYKKAGRHAHLVEFGTGLRRHKKTGKSVGSMPAQPFMRPAWDAGKGKLVPALGSLMADEIKKSVARAEAKARRALAKK